MKPTNKKGQLAGFGELAVGIATLAIVLVVAFVIISQARTQIISINSLNATDPHSGTNNLSTHGYNATLTLANALDDVPTWAPIIVIAFIGASLLGLVALFRRR